MSKLIAIDYPADRRRLKEEFGKMAAAPEFAQSVANTKELLLGARKSSKKRTKRKSARGRRQS